MGTKGEGNRQRIIEAADSLFYRRGYNQTSFQDISDATGIPRGNFYYYFKTKDDILNAVVDTRIAELTVMLNNCESATDDAKLYPSIRCSSSNRLVIGDRLRLSIAYGCQSIFGYTKHDEVVSHCIGTTLR